jgi:hypothetical protein
VGLFLCAARQSLPPPVEGVVMRITGWSFGGSQARLLVLPAIAIVGCTAWMLLPEPSDAESQSTASAPEVIYAQNASLMDEEVTPTTATLTNPAVPAEATPPASPSEEAAAAEKPPVDGLKISSQSWRRGGLGSKALVTLTLRNGNDYAVKDIEIFCAFTRRDGSHLTDRKRVINDTVNMKSRKTYARMLVGFVNINANKAKCSLVTASRS